MLQYSCNHVSCCSTTSNNNGARNNTDNDVEAPFQQKILPMHCYACVQARLSALTFTVSAAITDSDYTYHNDFWTQKYDEAAQILHQNQASALAGVRDFGLEESAYLMARGEVQLIKGLDEIEDVQGNGSEENSEPEVIELSDRLIIPGDGVLNPMRVVRERRSAPTIMDGQGNAGEAVFGRRFLENRRAERMGDVDGRVGDVNGKVDDVDGNLGDVDGQTDAEVSVEEMPEAPLKKNFFGGLRGLRDGAIARLGFRKDEKRGVELDGHLNGHLDGEMDGEASMAPKKKLRR
ncbi:hypothetical protein FKW77_007737 [Venturia effusa]|uniref:Uncharacterized protein n=1 Tax=Venturia effusa TaxID=50376 RepID=A0A517LB98_9PEZI|nr:hypothetical protein FKW77_007737 [Venturia effusa]